MGISINARGGRVGGGKRTDREMQIFFSFLQLFVFLKDGWMDGGNFSLSLLSISQRRRRRRFAIFVYGYILGNWE